MDLYRKISQYIENHLKRNNERILVVEGARQIGKSFIIRQVGRKLYENYIELNMEEDRLGNRIFSEARTVSDFYLALSVVAGSKMKEKGNTLVFIDEIQAYDHLYSKRILVGYRFAANIFVADGQYRNQTDVSDGF